MTSETREMPVTEFVLRPQGIARTGKSGLLGDHKAVPVQGEPGLLGDHKGRPYVILSFIWRQYYPAYPFKIMRTGDPLWSPFDGTIIRGS